MVSINIQGSSNKFTLQVDPTASIESVKEQIIEQSQDKPALDQLRLIYSGQILKNEKTVTEYNIQDGHTLHLVKRAASTASPAPTPNQPQVQNTPAESAALPPLSSFTGGMNTQHLLQQMQNAQAAAGGGGAAGAPGMRQINANQLRMSLQMLRANPELMRTMLDSGAMAQSGMTPEMLQMMLQPGYIEEFLQSFSDPGTS